MTKAKTTFENGATRSVKTDRFDLTPIEAEEALAVRFGLGAVRHSEQGWKKGGAQFIQATLNHARAHHTSLVRTAGGGEDDDLAAILCNYAMLTWFRKHKPSEYKKALEAMQ